MHPFRFAGLGRYLHNVFANNQVMDLDLRVWTAVGLELFLPTQALFAVYHYKQYKVIKVIG